MRNILVLIGSFLMFMSLAHGSQDEYSGSREQYSCKGSGPSQLTISFTVFSKQHKPGAFFVVAAFAQRPDRSPGAPGSLEMKWQRLVDASGEWETKYVGQDRNYSYYSHQANYKSLDQTVSFQINPVLLMQYNQTFDAIAEISISELGSR